MRPSRRSLRLLCCVIFVVVFGTDSFGQSIDRRAQEEAIWAKRTGLPVELVHKLWRSSSHFANEMDDDSRIVLLDVKSLASRNQLLLITSAGEPTCLTISVFSAAVGNWKVWSESQTPKGDGFCSALGITPEAAVENGKIVVTVPGKLISKSATHAEVGKYFYNWTGRTYLFGHEDTLLQFVPETDRLRGK